MQRRLQTALQLNQRGLLIGWMVVGLLVILSTQACSTIWAFANPVPHHWDNAMYLNQAYADFWAYTNGGPVHHQRGIAGVWDSMINRDPWLPPGYRFVWAPFIFSGVKMLAMLRAISLGVFWLTLYLLYRTGAVAIDSPAGKAAGILAAMLVSLYSEIGWSIRVSGTEHVLYFSVALLLFCLARATRELGKTHGTWIGLGFALGLGILSKVSFAMLAGPAVLVAVVLMFMRRLPGLTIWRWVGSAIIALVMAWPYYHLHRLEAVNYARDMMQFSRHSLHRSGMELLKAWVVLHVNEGLGNYAAMILGLLVTMAGIACGARWKWRARFFFSGVPEGPSVLSSDVDTTQPCGHAAKKEAAKSTILVAMAMGLPLPVFQLIFSTSDNVRHITPAYLPLTMVVALMAAATGTLVAWWSWLVLIAIAIPAYAQVHRDDLPLTTQPDDVWDWEPVYQIAQQHQLRFPMIGHVGNAGQFCDPTITFPWVHRGGWANSLWLWKAEDGEFDIEKVRAKMVDRDMVLTAPNFAMSGGGSMLADPVEKDNSHNPEFADAMIRDPAWQLAGKFPIGVINRAEIWVFIRK